MLKKNLILFTVLVIVLIDACKKYPDGPILSFHTLTERIAGSTVALMKPYKEWDVTYFSVNGYDSTDYLRNQPYYGKCKFIRDHDGYYGGGTMSYHGYSDGRWGLENNKDFLSASMLDASIGIANVSGLTYGGNPNPFWEIMRLTQREFWLKKSYNGKEYFLKLKN